MLCKSVPFPDLIHNVVQKFKDGHSRSTVHPMSCGEGAKITPQVKFLFNYIKAFNPENMNVKIISLSNNLHVCYMYF